MAKHNYAGKRPLLVGVDVGSTTTKIAVVDADSRQILFADYRRHHAEQLRSVQKALSLFVERFPGREAHVALTGSGAKTLSEKLGIPYVQEVVSNSVALKAKYQDVGTAIELGGQDAKIIFFRKDKENGSLQVADMRMNGSCAGGTGAFVDEVASILKTPVEELDALAAQGTCVYEISGRCGVYAKTDIQPLLNQGAYRSDLALSAFHAIAKQTIGGLAQGLEIRKPVAFEGGPLTFNHTLVRVFSERLNLSAEDMICPEHPEIMIAYGAALSAENMLEENRKEQTVSQMLRNLERLAGKKKSLDENAAPFFETEEECRKYREEHALPRRICSADYDDWEPGKAGGSFVGQESRELQPLPCYLGIDSGSTTTKFVLLDEDENILDSFYAPNEGEPLAVARKALMEMRDRYARVGIRLDILASGSTGYGEMLFSRAFSTECHVVETVAHVRAARKYVPDATFLLDIGGQDMKAIWLDNGVITNIVVNEACSSGCGSFLENFAASLHIPVEEIADRAFSSAHPAVLGSRCTVFMNSSIVTEQRNGKLPEDIMAGLCRSIIENVFTKVIRISNLDSLGNSIVVQGGTFENDAVLCAMEQYVGRSVTRAPYPGLMGAIGAALAAREEFLASRPKQEENHIESVSGDAFRTFIGLENLENFTYTQESNVTCPFCGNHCRRSVVRFSNGNSWVTNNRCERGEILGDVKEERVRETLAEKTRARDSVPNLYKVREKLLFMDYPVPEPEKKRDVVIGIPRVLSFWDTMPFWNAFWRSLGFSIVLSGKSTHRLFEEGLNAVTSDTVCFPAKLVHGHIRDLARKGVDRIFMPSIATVQSENTEKNSESMCAVVKGYPLVLKNSDNPQSQWGIPLDAPLFYWYRPEDRDRQLVRYMEETYDIGAEETKRAIQAACRAMETFREKLQDAGKKALQDVRNTGGFAIVLASRPYQNDSLVNHNLPEMFTELGVPVLTADSLPEVTTTDLRNSRIDVVNNYHGRMLSSAILAARDENLEYVQLVSFGCGHDAYLSDEIIRLMKEISGKTPLILKLDESEVQGPLRIRVRSFLETVAMRRRNLQAPRVHALVDPYHSKFTSRDRREKIALVPNTSHAFSRIMSAALYEQGVKAIPLEIGREEAIRLGKQYVHNDICFPAQIVIGEALAALKSGKYDNDNVAIAMGKYVGDCRLTHYTALLRKALDDVGFSQVPILTNDDEDYHNIHPGYKMGVPAALRIVFALPMIDALEALLRKIRPYEKIEGSADRAFEKAMDALVYGLQYHGIRGAQTGFETAIRIMKDVDYDRSHPRPGVLVVGEYLLNFHPGANNEIERYLEKGGFEVIEAKMTDVIRKTYFCQDEQVSQYHLKRNFSRKTWNHVANRMFDVAHEVTDRIASAHPLYTPACRLPDLVKGSDPVIPHTFDAGEGVLIPGEIIHHAEEGCRAFVILQPFGCLSNHVVGRGVVKRLKEMYPDAQILPLDYDPDVSFANVENRLQMLIMNVKEERRLQEKAAREKEEGNAPVRESGKSRKKKKYQGSLSVG
ncbi:MAG: acyl-CoA dehydratase activase [Clostridiales bacterium]|nr:acyl-CoA dehydratase activase [Clostridiales bacterium]